MEIICNEAGRPLEPDEIWVCSTCGGPKVEERRWVNLNTGEVVGNIGEGKFFCYDCQRLTESVMYLNEYNELNGASAEIENFKTAARNFLQAGDPPAGFDQRRIDEENKNN